MQGDLYLLPNDGSNANPAYGTPQRLEAGGNPIEAPHHGDSQPVAADWDGDGLQKDRAGGQPQDARAAEEDAALLRQVRQDPSILQALDGLGTGAEGSDRTETFFRLFGDSDGNGQVDIQDLYSFLSTWDKRSGDPGYLWYFDYNGDGRVDLADLIQLLRRLHR